MVYIRAKLVKGTRYGYLVESVWDSKKKTSKQVTLKYLGKLDNLTPDDLPEKYRSNEKIISFLTSHSTINLEEKQKLVKKLCQQTFDYLTNGDLESLLKMYENYENLFGTVDFYEFILKQVMYKIGDLWHKNELPIAAEHIASNVAHSFVKILSDRIVKPSTKQKILICTPPGESHNLGCNILESYLGSRGFKVFNLSPSSPTESIVSFIKDNSPHAVLVSVTLDDNISSAKRLVGKIKEKFKVPIFVGGRALSKEKHGFDDSLVQDLNLSALGRVLSTLH